MERSQWRDEAVFFSPKKRDSCWWDEADRVRDKPGQAGACVPARGLRTVGNDTYLWTGYCSFRDTFKGTEGVGNKVCTAFQGRFVAFYSRDINI